MTSTLTTSTLTTSTLTTRTGASTTAIAALVTPTPAGTLTTLIRTGVPQGAAAPHPTADLVVAAGFTAVDVLRQRLADADASAAEVLAGGGSPIAEADPDGPVGRAVQAWLDGDLAAITKVSTAQRGTAFQHAVWRALGEIPAGSTATYTELSAAAGRPAAVRAAGSACGRNLIAPWVPCHRAVRADGGLGGYAWGLDAKRWLLAHEARHGA